MGVGQGTVRVPWIRPQVRSDLPWERSRGCTGRGTARAGRTTLVEARRLKGPDSLVVFVLPRWGWKDKRELTTNAPSTSFKVDLGAFAREGTSGFRQRMCSDLPFTKSSRQPARLEPGRPARTASRQCRREAAVAARPELDHRVAGVSRPLRLPHPPKPELKEPE